MNQMQSGPAPVVSQPVPPPADPLADRPSIVAEEPVLNGDREPSPPSGEQPPEQPAAKPEPTKAAEVEQKRSRASERIGQLVAEKRAAEAQAAAALAENRRLRQQLTRPDPATMTPEQENAISVREAVRAEAAEQAEIQARQQLENLASVRADMWMAKVDAAREQFPDMDAALGVFERLPFTDAECDLIAESDRSAELTYHFGKNPQDFYRLQTMPPHRRAAEIARLEAKVASPPPKRTTQAPPPVPTVSGGPAPAGFNPDTSSAADYSAWYRQQYKR